MGFFKNKTGSWPDCCCCCWSIVTPSCVFLKGSPKAASCKVSLNYEYSFRWDVLKQNRKSAILLLLLLINNDPLLYFRRGHTMKLSVKFHWICPCSFRGDSFKQLLTDVWTDKRRTKTDQNSSLWALRALVS